MVCYFQVLDFHHPHHLKEMMSHCLGIPSEGVTLEQVLSDCKETMKYGVRTGFINFMDFISMTHQNNFYTM